MNKNIAQTMIEIVYITGRIDMIDKVKDSLESKKAKDELYDFMINQSQ